LIPNTWSLILGSKVEYNVFTGVEFQPSVRTAWNPHPNHTIWAAFSRAVRLPNLSEEDFQVNRILIPAFSTDNPSPWPIFIQESNDGRTDAEVLLAYELGYRLKASEKVNFDFTAYYFDYDNLIEINDGLPTPPFGTVPPGTIITLPVFNANSLKGEIYGVELSGQWEVFRNWRLSGSYTFAEIQLDPLPGFPISSNAFNSEGDIEAEGEPSHIFNVRSYLNLPYNLELDTFYYFVSENKSRSIPAYSRVDVRLGWEPMKNVNLSFVAQNLLDETHPELNELLEVESETQRSYYLKATLKF